MSEAVMFKIKEKFSSVGKLYKYVLKNVDFRERTIGIKIQKPLKYKLLCVVGKEKITERNILFFASKSEYPESLGELIILAGAFDADIVVYFLPKLNVTKLESLNWLQKVCNNDTQFVFIEANF